MWSLYMVSWWGWAWNTTRVYRFRIGSCRSLHPHSPYAQWVMGILAAPKATLVFNCLYQEMVWLETVWTSLWGTCKNWAFSPLLVLNLATQAHHLSRFTSRTLTISLLNSHCWHWDLDVCSVFRKCVVSSTVQIKTLKCKVNKQRYGRISYYLCIYLLETSNHDESSNWAGPLQETE